MAFCIVVMVSLKSPCELTITTFFTLQFSIRAFFRLNVFCLIRRFFFRLFAFDILGYWMSEVIEARECWLD